VLATWWHWQQRLHRVDGGARGELEGLLGRIVDLFPGGKESVAWFALLALLGDKDRYRSVAFLHALSSSRDDMHAWHGCYQSLSSLYFYTIEYTHTHSLLSLLLGICQVN
jgi:hypothetical protein